MSLPDLLAGASVVIAGLAALLAGYYSKKTVEFSRRAEAAASQANQHAGHSNVISANSWIDQYLCNVRLWADEACDSIARAMHATGLKAPERERELFESMYRLSSLIDRGRWFFPNQWNDEIGLEKAPAYRGLRQPILDYLVMAYDSVEELRDPTKNATIDKLLNNQRLFVSEVQQVLNPRRREEEVRRIDEQFAISEKITITEGSGVK